MATDELASPARLYAMQRKYAYATYELVSHKTIMTIRGPKEKRIYLGKYYNCFSKKIWSSRFSAREGVDYPVGVKVDLRSLQLLKWGCCPDELAIDMIEGYE
jgi:hypothetical protein